MTPEEIKIELYKRRKAASMALLARKIGVTRQAVYNTVERRNRSMRIAQAVAEAIGRPLCDVFPELAENSRQSGACN